MRHFLQIAGSIIAFAIVTTLLIKLTETKPIVAGHVCIDQTHVMCDGKCICDGLGCVGMVKISPIYNAVQVVQARDYQIDIVEDSLLIFDGSRYVGTIPAFDSSKLSLLLQTDNQ